MKRLFANIHALHAVMAAVAIVALPLLLGSTTYALDVATIALVYALFALSWDFFCGATGELSFGQTFFTGTAAFATAIVQSRLGAPPFLALLAGVAAGAVAGLAIGTLTLRHTGAVFTMVTMAAQLSFHRTLFLWSDIFGGEEGIFVAEPIFSSPLANYAFVSVLSLLAVVFASVVRTSSFGRQLRASGGDTRLGLASGVPVSFVRMAGATVSGAIGGLGGSLYAFHFSVANHEIAGDALAGLIFLLAAVGGAGTLIGPWLVAVLYVAVVRESLAALGETEPIIVFGTLFLAIWIMPEGPGKCLRAISLPAIRARLFGEQRC